ncbi:MAG: helix-turn-helix domain-containing protein [Nanoarchaeota archaeon]|nr:helix-turn-helix domain-containing protein [Nanoarchaeota archaeon]
MAKKYLMMSLDDESTKKVAEVIGNNTCKKIIDFLSETKEASESDIASSLNIPLNTVGYNIKKLVEAKLVEKTKNHFWSQKGKKIAIYTLSNKSIVISPKSNKINKFANVLPAVLVSALATAVLRYYALANQVTDRGADFAGEKIMAGAPQVAEYITEESIKTTANTGIWIWFLGGALFALAIYLTLNWRRM